MTAATTAATAAPRQRAWSPSGVRGVDAGHGRGRALKSQGREGLCCDGKWLTTLPQNYIGNLLQRFLDFELCG